MPTLNIGSYPLNQNEIYAVGSGVKSINVFPAHASLQESSNGSTWTDMPLSGGSGSITKTFLRSNSSGVQIVLKSGVTGGGIFHQTTLVLTHTQLLAGGDYTIVPASAGRMCVPTVIVGHSSIATIYGGVGATIDVGFMSSGYGKVVVSFVGDMIRTTGDSYAMAPIDIDVATAHKAFWWNAAHMINTPLEVEVPVSTGGNAANTFTVCVSYLMFDNATGMFV